ncbi:uncharacterized protein LOC144039382 isoform X1 [Vanacampus margaritifer]
MDVSGALLPLSSSSVLGSVLVLLLAYVAWSSASSSPQPRRQEPPGPRPLPLLGNLLHLNLRGPHRTLLEMSKKYGPVFTFHMGPKKVVVLAGYKTVKEALVQHAEEFGERDPLNTIKETKLEHGVIWTNGDSWKEMRRFALSNLRDFGMGKKACEDKIVEECQHLLEVFKNFRGEAFDTQQALNYAVSNIICSLVFGSRFQYDDPAFTGMVQRTSRNIQIVGGPSLQVAATPHVHFHVVLIAVPKSRRFPSVVQHVPVDRQVVLLGEGGAPHSGDGQPQAGHGTDPGSEGDSQPAEQPRLCGRLPHPTAATGGQRQRGSLPQFEPSDDRLQPVCGGHRDHLHHSQMGAPPHGQVSRHTREGPSGAEAGDRRSSGPGGGPQELALQRRRHPRDAEAVRHHSHGTPAPDQPGRHLPGLLHQEGHGSVPSPDIRPARRERVGEAALLPSSTFPGRGRKVRQARRLHALLGRSQSLPGREPGPHGALHLLRHAAAALPLRATAGGRRGRAGPDPLRGGHALPRAAQALCHLCCRLAS